MEITPLFPPSRLHMSFLNNHLCKSNFLAFIGFRRGAPPLKKPRPKEILAKRTGELRSQRMNLIVKTRNDHRDTAISSRFSSLLTAHSALFTSFSPLSPAPPFSPPSGLRQGYDRQAGPATGPFNGLHPKSKFLAVLCRGAPPLKKPRPKEILAKRTGELRSQRMNLIVKTRNDHRDTAISSRFSSLLTRHFSLLSPPFLPHPPFPRPPVFAKATTGRQVRPPAPSTAFTPKANS